MEDRYIEDSVKNAMKTAPERMKVSGPHSPASPLDDLVSRKPQSVGNGFINWMNKRGKLQNQMTIEFMAEAYAAGVEEGKNHEFICRKCGLRQNYLTEKDEPNF